jgi:hypothetical protein
MIDWRLVVLNALWICGLALMLATTSLASYRVAVEKLGHPVTGHLVRKYLAMPGFQRILWIGAGLVSLSLALISTIWLERLVWGGALLSCLLMLAHGIRQPKR